MLVNSEAKYMYKDGHDVANLIQVEEYYAALFDIQYQKLFYDEWCNLCTELYMHLSTYYNGTVNRMLINDNGKHPYVTLEINRPFVDTVIEPILNFSSRPQL